MIHYIKISNFHSINGIEKDNPFIFDLRVDKKSSPEEYFYRSINEIDKISTSQAILGENASGKTNVLKAICFLRHIIINKTLNDSNTLNHYLNFFNNNDNTYFEIGLEIDAVYFEYNITFNKLEIKEEILKYKDYKDEGNLKTILKRETKNNKVILSSNDKDLQKIFDRSEPMAIFNSYFANAISKNHHDNKCLQLFYKYFYNNTFNNLNKAGDIGTAINNKDSQINIFDFYNDINHRIFAVHLFNKLNQPIKNISLSKENINEEVVKEQFKKMGVDVNDPNFKINPIYKVNFNYKYDNQELNVEHIYEAMGNRKLFDIIPALYKILNEDKNNVLIYDELDKNFHPELLYFIVSLFNDKEINKTNSQIIFTSHCYPIINELSRHKITFIDKNKKTGESEIYKLSDIEGSADFSNPYQKYINGSLGSYPIIRE